MSKTNISAFCPAHPGSVLLAMYLEPAGITQTALATAIGVTRKHVSEIVHGRASVTPALAVRLGRALGTTPEVWVNLQSNHDLWHAQRDSTNTGVRLILKPGAVG